MDQARFVFGEGDSLQRSPSRRLVLPIQRFARCARGIAAIEFGFIAPIMLVMLLGAVEITRAVSIDRRFGEVTAAIADVVTRGNKDANGREQPFTIEDINAIYDVAAQMMSPFDVAPLKISIIPVKASGVQTVSYVAPQNLPSFNGGAQPGRCQAFPIAPGLIDPAPGSPDSVIVVNATYSYEPMFLGMIMRPAHWQQQAFAKPRTRSCLDFDGPPNSCTQACT